MAAFEQPALRLSESENRADHIDEKLQHYREHLKYSSSSELDIRCKIVIYVALRDDRVIHYYTSQQAARDDEAIANLLEHAVSEEQFENAFEVAWHSAEEFVHRVPEGG